MPDFKSAQQPHLEGHLDRARRSRACAPTAQGDKYKLSLMRGTGMFGNLGGGDGQREGMEALSRWFERFARRD